MTLKRMRILKAAADQIGSHDDDLAFPGLYYSGGYNWCSEFVSFIYCRAGYPFTEGSYSTRIVEPPDDGKWMQRTTGRIIEWFKERGQYLHRNHDGEQWNEYDPKPGDFVFIGRVGSDRMHSGLVDYTSPDGSLHTIEGNNAGRPVMRFSYPRYKINDIDNGAANGIIMGIGVLSD